MHVNRILETCLYADDLDAAEDFYSRVLGMESFARVEGRHVFFRCGDSVFLVFRSAKTREDSGEGIPPHGADGPGHVAFAMAEGAIEAWRQQLESEGVAIESDYTWPNGGRSLYFRDPAGNSLELTTPRTWRLQK